MAVKVLQRFYRLKKYRIFVALKANHYLSYVNRLSLDVQVSHEKKPGWLFDIGDYSTQLYIYIGIMITYNNPF